MYSTDNQKYHMSQITLSLTPNLAYSSMLYGTFITCILLSDERGADSTHTNAAQGPQYKVLSIGI